MLRARLRFALLACFIFSLCCLLRSPAARAKLGSEPEPNFATFSATRNWTTAPRGVVMVLLHGSRLSEAHDSRALEFMALTFSDLDDALLRSQQLDLLIAYTDACCTERDIVKRLSLLSRSEPGFRALGSGIISSRLYSSSLDTRVIIERIVLDVPSYLPTNDVAREKMLSTGTWRHCAGRAWPVEYIEANMFYIRQAFESRSLDAYDFWFKVDVDVWMMHPLPFRLVDVLARRRALFLHTQLTVDTISCTQDIDTAVDAFERLYQPSVANRTSALWPQTTAFYGNFIGGWLGFWTAPEVMRLARYLEAYPEGFFMHRWTDQQYWPKALYAFATLAQQQDNVLDFTPLRGAYFKHVGPADGGFFARRVACDGRKHAWFGKQLRSLTRRLRGALLSAFVPWDYRPVVADTLAPIFDVGC